MERINFSPSHFGNLPLSGRWLGQSEIRAQGRDYSSCPLLTRGKKVNTVNYYYYWGTLYNMRRVSSSSRCNNAKCACKEYQKPWSKTNKAERWNTQIHRNGLRGRHSCLSNGKNQVTENQDGYYYYWKLSMCLAKYSLSMLNTCIFSFGQHSSLWVG